MKLMNPVNKIDDQIISLTDSCRPTTFLGLMIDKYLNWTDHGKTVLSKASSDLHGL